MKRPLSSPQYVVGASLLAFGAALWLVYSYPQGGGHATQEPAPPPQEQVAPAPIAKGVETEVAAPAQAATQAPVPDVLAEKKALIAEAEEGRIAAREEKLAKLDWNAARPAAPVREGPEPVGKREAAMPPAEKVEQTQIMIARLLERRAVLETRMREAAAKGTPRAESDAFMVDRLERRVAQLEETAQSLRDKSK